MARAKRIYEIAKEFARDEKEIIEFLSAQGIRVANRLSAVNEDTYNLLKVKFTEPPKVEEPEPPKVKEPPIEQPKTEQAETPSPKKKKKNKGQQTIEGEVATAAAQVTAPQFQAQPMGMFNAETRAVYDEAIRAGNEFIAKYVPISDKRHEIPGNMMNEHLDAWGLLRNARIPNVDESPALYWNAVNKLTTAAYKKIQKFALERRDNMAEMRETMKEFGAPYVPREIFTDEENERFAKQKKFLFETFGHGQGALNDQLLALKIYCNRMNYKFERMNFVDYLTNPDSEYHIKPRVPYSVMSEVIVHCLRGLIRRYYFYRNHKDTILFAMKNFSEWIDGYQKLKEDGAPEAKLKRYLELEEKFIYLTEFMSYDNLLFIKQKKGFVPYVPAVEVLNAYRDDLDNPEALATFQYDMRGKVMHFLVKPKEFVFLWQLIEL